MSGVGQIDPSIAVNANRPQMDLLGTAGQAVGIQNALLQGAQQRQALQAGQIGIDQNKLALAQAHYQALGSLFSSALNVPAAGTKMPDGTISQGLTDEYLHAIAQRGIAMGLMTPDQAAQELAVMPPDDAGKRQQLRELLFSVQDNATRLQALNPAATMVDTGAGKIPMSFKAGAPPEQMGSAIPYGVAATRMSTVNTNPNDQNYGATQSEIVPGSGPGSSASAAPSAPAAGTPSSTVQTSLPPGTEGFMGAGAQRAQQLVASTSQIGEQRALIENLAAETKALPADAFGPGSHFVQKAGRWFQEINGEDVENQQTGIMDTFSKNAQQLANALLPAIGNSSDRSQVAAVASNPNLELSKQGVERITNLLRGSLDATQAKSRAFVNDVVAGKTTPGAFNTWESNFNQDYDPRAFQWQYMSNDQKKEAIAEMGGTKSQEFQKFRAFFNKAAANGWLPTIKPHQ